MLTILLMFIGGASGSTAGGVKVSTIAVMIATFRAVLRGRTDITLMKRRIDTGTVLRAFAILSVAVGLILVSSFALFLSERENLPFLSILYECTSAYATVGLSLGLTPTLNLVSQCILMLLMFCGRVGTLTISFALTMNMKKEQNKIHYPETRILIG